MTDYYQLAETLSLRGLKQRYPAAHEFLINYRLERIDDSLPFYEAVEAAEHTALEEFGMGAEDALDELCVFLSALEKERVRREISSVTVIGGHDKSGAAESAILTVRRGEAVALVGPTGAGKSRLLSDIECAARGDTPTGRHVLFDGAELDDEKRFSLGGSLVAQLSQNMNFVIDMSVGAFLELHSRCRGGGDDRDVAKRCFCLALELAGEPFTWESKVTELSGGQSRALMIADAAAMSPSPILLIDEIENAGIDRLRAVKLLTGENKIVLLSTHDPLLALRAARRAVIKNGGISAVMETTDEEREHLAELSLMEEKITAMRDELRRGERVQG